MFRRSGYCGGKPAHRSAIRLLHLERADLWRYGLVLIALLIVGIVHRLIGDPIIPEREDRT